MAVNGRFEEIAAELEAQGWHKEAELLRRFPRSAWDDELVKGMFVAAVSVRDIERAEKVARQLVTFAPENPFAYLALCLVKLRQGQTDEAAKAFDRALHFASTLPTYRAQKVHWFCLQGKLKEARQILRETLKEYSDRWEIQRAQAHLWLSRPQLSFDRAKRAVDLLKRLVRLHPDDAATHALLAQALWNLGERKQAKKHLRAMAENLPTLTFTDTDSFVVWEIAKATLATCFVWLKPNWLLERFLLRWLPPRYFVAVGTFWGAVALILAVLKPFVPTTVFAVLVVIAGLGLVYNRFADAFLLWFLRRIHDSGD
ncbi:MAG: tetratricopeptide repeat protein [Armatimonadetes bacterium]|nr:tetratricopeptide repeat protein [Armatimonadota bacterium]